MKIGFLGLGKMGTRMVAKLISDKHEVIVWNRSKEVTDEFVKDIKSKDKNAKIDFVYNIEDFPRKFINVPYIFWLMLPAGDATDFAISQIAKFFKKGDIIIDGGNAYFKDTQKRYEILKKQGISYLGIGVSGGIIAEKDGYPLMVGGDNKAYEKVKPLLKSLAKPKGGYEYLGEGGAGHFAKMVHNGIEYGIMQALGEGFGVLEKAPYKFNLLKVAKIWQKGTLVAGFLLDRARDALEKDVALSDVEGIIDSATKEGIWTIQQAKDESVPLENIEQAMSFRIRSHNDQRIQNSFAAKMVSAIRYEFGGHQIRRKSKIKA